jgi:anthranilate phosphoribosyltransferase
VPGGDPEENAAITRHILDGEAGAARDLAVLNAGAAIYAGGRAESLEAGVRAAEQAIDSGAARAAMAGFVEQTRELAPR